MRAYVIIWAVNMCGANSATDQCSGVCFVFLIATLGLGNASNFAWNSRSVVSVVVDLWSTFQRERWPWHFFNGPLFGVGGGGN